MPSLLSAEYAVDVAERLLTVLDQDTISINYGPAIFAGLKIGVIAYSEKYVWFTRNGKEHRIPRHWLIGNCRQNGRHAV